MRFGRTKEEVHAAWREWQHLLNMGRERFAWIPVQLHDGSWLWLEPYVAARRLSGSAGWQRVRFIPGSKEHHAHIDWAMRHAERWYW